TGFTEGSGGSAVVWTNDALTTTLTSPVILGAPGGLPSSDAFAVHAGLTGLGGMVAGIGYDEAIGRGASSVPAAWNFVKNSLGLAWRGTWVPIELTDDTG